MSSTGTINKISNHSNQVHLHPHHRHSHHLQNNQIYHHKTRNNHHRKCKNNTNSTTSCSTSCSSQDGSSSSTAIYIDEQEDINNIHNDDNNNNNNDIKEIISDEQQKMMMISDEQKKKPPPIHHRQQSSESSSHSLQLSSNGWVTFNQHNNNNNNINNNNTNNNNNNNKNIINNKSKNKNNVPITKNSLFGHDCTDYMANFKLFQKLYSPQEYYANLQISHLPLFNSKKYKDRRSDCPSEISSIDSRRRRKKKISYITKLFSWMKYINSIICQIVKFTFDFIILSCNKLQKWQKDIQEAPIEVKEKYFFVISTIISTSLFCIFFLCLDFMIKHWFALPHFITNHSFSISYCISYLTSVIWQHFLNQYFVFALRKTTISITNNNNNNNDFCNSLFRTYLVYGCSLLLTGILTYLLQIYCGIDDDDHPLMVLSFTLPVSGAMNYYLLRYCHNKHNQNNNNNNYQPLPTTSSSTYPKPRHSNNKQKYSKSTSHILYNNHSSHHHHHHHHHHQNKKYHHHHKTVDDIVIV